jgi:hypothetical protein
MLYVTRVLVVMIKFKLYFEKMKEPRKRVKKKHPPER